jgi:hypothetical protein
MKKMPGKAEQLDAFLHGNAYEFTMKYAGRDQHGFPQYSKVFTITKKDILDYIKKNYKLNNLPMTYSSPSRKDGYYIIPIPDSTGYRTYYQERGIKGKEIVAYNEEEALLLYVKHRLLYSTSGIKDDEE